MVLRKVLGKIKGIWRYFVSAQTKKVPAEEATLKKSILDNPEQQPILTEHQTKSETPTSLDIPKVQERTGRVQIPPALFQDLSYGNQRRSKKRKKGSRKNLNSK